MAHRRNPPTDETGEAYDRWAKGPTRTETAERREAAIRAGQARAAQLARDRALFPVGAAHLALINAFRLTPTSGAARKGMSALDAIVNDAIVLDQAFPPGRRLWEPPAPAGAPVVAAVRVIEQMVAEEMGGHDDVAWERGRRAIEVLERHGRGRTARGLFPRDPVAQRAWSFNSGVALGLVSMFLWAPPPWKALIRRCANRACRRYFIRRSIRPHRYCTTRCRRAGDE